MFEEFRLFYSEVRSNYATIGAIAPSSRLLAKAVVLPLSQRPPRPISVLEVGAGTGAFTERILKHLHPGDVLDIYELNPKFYSFLRESLKSTRTAERGIGCTLYNADIRTLSKDIQYDYIISSLPLNSFDSQKVAEILDIYIRHLSPTGVLSYFEYIFTHEFKSKFLKPQERERLIQVAKTVGKFIQMHQFSCNQVWWNLPPAMARYCRKTASGTRLSN